MPGDEETNVRMARRHVGIARVNHERDAERLPGFAGEFGTMRRGRRGQFGAANVGESDARFLEHTALRENPRPATATESRLAIFGARPFVGAEFRAAILRFQRGANGILQPKQVGANAGKVGRHGRE